MENLLKLSSYGMGIFILWAWGYMVTSFLLYMIWSAFIDRDKKG